MRCERFNATISTAYCLKKQGDHRVLNHLGAPTNREVVTTAHPCFKCAQGERIRKGEGDDMDVENLKSGEGKICSKCRVFKPKSRFLPASGNADGLGHICLDCQSQPAAKAKPGPKPKVKDYKDRHDNLPPHGIKPDPIMVEPKPQVRVIRAVEITGVRIPLCEDCMKRFLEG